VRGGRKHLLINNKEAGLSQHFFFRAGTVVRGDRKHLLINNKEAGLSQHFLSCRYCSERRKETSTNTVNNQEAGLSQHFFCSAGTVVRGGRKHLLINNQEAGLSQHLFCSAAKIRRETSTVKKLNCLKHFLQRRYCKEKRKLRIFVKKTELSQHSFFYDKIRRKEISTNNKKPKTG
jgi:hypothetical protein